MTVPAWDLDAPVDQDRVITGFRPGLVLLIAVGLVGLGLGGLIGSALAPDEGPRFPAIATMDVRDVYVDTSATVPSGGSRPGTGNAVAVVRLQVYNPGALPVRLSALELDGVTRKTIRLPLDVQVPGHGSRAVDLTVHPDCSPGREAVGVRARLSASSPGGNHLDDVRVAPARTLSRFGGLCSQLNIQLPSGWQALLQANATRQDGADLEITLDDQSGARLAGLQVNGRLLPTVFVGDQLFSSSAQLQPGAQTQLRLTGNSRCVQFNSGTSVPTTLRLLAQGNEGVAQRLVVVGPELTRWLRDCG
jgi:hypothetical protein